MISSNRFWTLAALLVLALLTGPPVAAAQSAGEPGPLAPFSRLVGGAWYLGDQYQVFEWGMDAKSLDVRGYRLQDGEPVLVSHGVIFFHPGEETVRGVVVAEGMGIDLFDYRMRFEGDRMTAALVTYGQMAGEFHEVWEFTDENHYRWSLSQKTDEGLQEMMSGTFERR